MFVSKNFTTEELKIDEKTEVSAVINMCILVHKILQPLRDELNEPIRITSGYRDVEYNSSIGGVKNSQHIYGMAVDFTCKNIGKAFRTLKNGNFKFDQLIYYKSRKFIHVSYSELYNRNQVLTF